MKNFNKIIIAMVLAVVIIPQGSMAQKKVTVHGNATLVSDYVWRGAYQSSGVSIQPSVTLSYAGISLNVFGNQSISKDAKEFDINLSYSIHHFTLTVSDYWWTGVDKAYGDYSNDHFFEATLGYKFGSSFPLALTWSTIFAGGDKDEDGELQASTYISASCPISLPAGIILTPAVGFTPWEGMYHKDAAVTDVSLTASKELKLGSEFNLPVFLQAIASPAYDRTYLVAGISIGF